MNFWVVLFLCGVVLLGIFGFASKYTNIQNSAMLAVSEHALSKHGTDAEIIDACLNRNGNSLGTWHRQSDNHFAFPCQIEPEKYGIKINSENDVNGKNITTIPKDKMKKSCQVIRYLLNSGYEPYDDVARAWFEANPIKFLGW